MLLLVIETDFHERGDRGQSVLTGSLENFTTAASTCRR